MADNLTKPYVFANTFCNSGDKTGTIPVADTNTNSASLAKGFPVITSTAIGEGGIPPKRTDFNGILNALSQYCLFLQNGGEFEYSSAVATAIGGYPSGAILNYTDTNGNTYRIKSLINNNSNAPSSSNIRVDSSAEGTYYWEVVSLNKDIDNISSVGKNNIRAFVFPDYSSGENRTAGTSYTATKNGYIFASGQINAPGGYARIKIDGISFSLCTRENDSGSLFMPVSVGQQYTTEAGSGGSITDFKFFSCKDI